MAQLPVEHFKVIDSARCDDAGQLMEALYNMCERDPRGEDVGQATAVAIDNRYVVLQLREFEDGTRIFVLLGA